MPEMPPTVPRSRFSSVVVASGHMIDHPQRVAPRFPPSRETAVAGQIEAALRTWKAGAGALLVCGGARGTDILAAEQALLVGADVWLLIAMADDEFVETSVHLDGTDWKDRYQRLRRRCPTWFQSDELGPPEDGEDVFERNNDWALAVARAQAPAGLLRALVVWDGRQGDGPGGTADFVDRARQAGADVHVIRP